MFSIETMIAKTAHHKNGKFNGVRAELQNDEIPAEILILLEKRKPTKAK